MNLRSGKPIAAGHHTHHLIPPMLLFQADEVIR